MRLPLTGLLWGLLLAVAPSASAAVVCPPNPQALGTSRVMAIDTNDGPRFGSWRYPSSPPPLGRKIDALNLAPGEVVLTFDDGPHPRHTRRILRALNRHCVKATFFSVGIWARQVPRLMRAIVAHGHSVGAHTWSHPYRIDLRKFAFAKQEVERGFEAVRIAAGGTIAPFLRYPGLRETKALNALAAARGYGIFSTDVATDDWKGIDARTIVRRTMARLKRRGRGIVLLHDNKPETAKAVPLLLHALKHHGFTIVHLVPKVPLTGPEETADAKSAEEPSDKLRKR